MSLVQNTILKMMRKMALGSLHLVLPDGSEEFIGDKESKSLIQASIRIHHERFFQKVFLSGHIGFAEAYIDGDWDTDDIESVISWAILNIETSPFLEGSSGKPGWINLLGSLNKLMHMLRKNSISNASHNIQAHYDLSNDFFKLFLDSTMAYSSAVFNSPDQSLDEAQLAKYEKLCQKLRLKHTDHVLEIGSGWGGFACYAATRYGCHVHTVTLSNAQYHYVNELIRTNGLSHKVTISIRDYRDLQGQYDKIVSIEMLEAVGDEYYEAYFSKCNALLKPQGLLLIQAITCPDSRFVTLKNNVDFIQKHIFPGSLLPSLGRINNATLKTGNLFLHELEDLGQSYVRTLRIWNHRFQQHIDVIRSQGFDEKFIRKWRYYFLYCAAAFKMRNITVVQALYTPPNNLLLSDLLQSQISEPLMLKELQSC